MWGCRGGGKVPHFKGTEHETRRCPRRHLLDHPDVVEIFGLRKQAEKADGLSLGERLTTAAIEGIETIDDAVAWNREAAAEREKSGGA